MIKVDVKGCSSFVDAAKYESYVAKALDAFDVPWLEETPPPDH